ncbi:MAG: ABC transporter substrate-binding protein [Eubacteriales bacterium]
MKQDDTSKNKSKERGDRTWGFLGVWLLIFLFNSAALLQQQDELDDLSTDSRDIEYLSSSTQRLVRLALSDQRDQALLSYLDAETEILLQPESDSSISVLRYQEYREMIDVVLYNWDVVLDLIDEEDIDNNTLLLAADNHFYQMTNLADAINEQSQTTRNRVTDTQYRMGLLLVILSIVVFNNGMKTRAELKDKREEAKLALLDATTGLYNRSKCHELFKSGQNSEIGKRPAIIVFDLNDLKKTNDFRGHRVGDELIRSFATLLKQSVLVNSTYPFMGRFGGDEFIIFYEHIESEDEIVLILKELNFLAQQFNQKENRFRVSYACGYEIGEMDQEVAIRTLFDRADELMYENKKLIKAEQTEKNQDFQLVKDENLDELEHLEDDDLDAKPDFEKRSLERQQATTRNTCSMIAGLIAVVTLYIGTYLAVQKANETYIGGNTIYLAIGGGTEQPDLLGIGNPWNNGNISSIMVFRALFTPTTDFTDVTPDLATDYKISDDGLTYQFTLKEGMYWSDGNPIVMDDIVFSFESFILCGNGNVNLLTAFHKIVGASQFKDGLTDHLEGLEVDGNTMTIHLDAPHNTFMQMLAQFVPLPSHILSEIDVTTITSDIDFFYNPVSSGMYMVEGMNEDGNLVMVQNPYYTEEKSDIEQVIFLWDYNNESIDLYSTSNITQMVSYRAMRGVEEYTVDVHFYRYFVYNLVGGYDAKTVAELESEDLTEEPMEEELEDLPEEEREPNYAIEDVRIRQAISHAIDRQQLLSDLYFDTGTLTIGGPANVENEEIYYYSPERARELLIEANYDFDRVFTIAYYHSDATTYIFLQQVKEYLEAVGLTVELIKSVTGNQFLYDERPYDMLLKGLSSFNTDDWYNEFLSTNGNMSSLMGDNGEFDELVDRLSSTTNQEDYRAILDELVALEVDLVYKMPLFTLNESVYIRESRLHVPDDMVFTNTRYRSDLRLEEWYIKKA